MITERTTTTTSSYVNVLNGVSVWRSFHLYFTRAYRCARVSTSNDFGTTTTTTIGVHRALFDRDILRTVKCTRDRVRAPASVVPLVTVVVAMMTLLTPIPSIALANDTHSFHGGKWRPLIMLSGPEQSSTLVSDAIRKAVNETFLGGIVKGCRETSRELLVPECQTSKQRAVLYAKCIPSLGLHGQKTEFWNTCSSSDFENVFREAGKLYRWKFTKVLSFNGWHLETLHKRRHPLFVVFRKPEHTFPISKRDRHYFAFWRSLMSTTSENLRMLPAGADLLRLRNHARNVFNGILKQTDHRIFSGTTGIRGVQECLGHFFHFWHLITVAKSLNVPVFSVESLLLAHSRDEALIALKASGACTSLSIGSADICEKFVDYLRELQTVPIMMHLNVTEIFEETSFSSVALMRDREKKYYEQTKCAPFLSAVTSWCRDNIRNCATVSDLYSVATVGTSLDYLSPLKQGRLTKDDIFNRTFARGVLHLPGGEKTTETKRLEMSLPYSVVYVVMFMCALITLAGLLRFFRKEREVEIGRQKIEA